MRIIFFGTSVVAAEFLGFLTKHHQIVLAVTTTPKPAGRGWEIKPSAVAEFCQKNNLQAIAVDKFDKEVVNKIAQTKADLGVVVDFGKIIPEEIFNCPEYKTINVHFSLLPRWRGAAPIPWALLSGDKETGVSIFYLEKSLDTGPILAKEKITIADDDDAISLEKKLVELGKELLKPAIEEIRQKKMKITPQTGEITFAPSLKKYQGLIDWNRPAAFIHNQVRALVKWPRAYTFYPTENGRKMLKILQSEAIAVCPGDDKCCPVSPANGIITGCFSGVGFVVKCGVGFLLIKKVLPQDKKLVSAWDFWQGARLTIGVRLG